MQFIVYQEGDGKWRWDLRCNNGWHIAHSGTSYKSWENCMSVVDVVRNSRLASIKTIPLKTVLSKAKTSDA